jgi:hypothetical protein
VQRTTSLNKGVLIPSARAMPSSDVGRARSGAFFGELMVGAGAKLGINRVVLRQRTRKRALNGRFRRPAPMWLE